MLNPHYTGIGDGWIEASPLEDGTFKLRGKGTYHNKDQIKAIGGRWEPKGQYWIVPLEALKQIPHTRLYRVRIAPYCHETSEEIHWASDTDIKRGYVHTFCGHCDSRSGGKIIEVLPDDPAHVGNDQTKAP